MNLKNVILGIAILILTISVAVYGINTFYSEPSYEDFCDNSKFNVLIETQNDCIEIGGKWNEDLIPRKVDNTNKSVTGYCERDYTCRNEFDEAQQKYSKSIFLIAVPLGIIIIALGAFVFGLEAVGAGLMGGGVGVILYGVGGFWRFADDWLKFVLSLVGLLAVIYLAYWFNRKDWNIWKKK